MGGRYVCADHPAAKHGPRILATQSKGHVGVGVMREVNKAKWWGGRRCDAEEFGNFKFSFVAATAGREPEATIVHCFPLSPPLLPRQSFEV